MSNVLSLPLTECSIETGTNEDWVDSLVYLIDSTDPLTGPQQDLREMRFAMHVRRYPPEIEVIIEASTEMGGLFVPPAPDFGFLVINIPMREMKLKIPGNYVGDIVAMDDKYERVIIRFELTIIEGVTRWLSEMGRLVATPRQLIAAE